MKEYKNLAIEILLLSEDIVTASVYVKWDSDWTSKQGETWEENIFG